MKTNEQRARAWILANPTTWREMVAQAQRCARNGRSFAVRDFFGHKRCAIGLPTRRVKGCDYAYPHVISHALGRYLVETYPSLNGCVRVIVRDGEPDLEPLS